MGLELVPAVELEGAGHPDGRRQGHEAAAMGPDIREGQVPADGFHPQVIRLEVADLDGSADAAEQEVAVRTADAGDGDRRGERPHLEGSAVRKPDFEIHRHGGDALGWPDRGYGWGYRWGLSPLPGRPVPVAARAIGPNVDAPSAPPQVQIHLFEDAFGLLGREFRFEALDADHAERRVLAGIGAVHFHVSGEVHDRDPGVMGNLHRVFHPLRQGLRQRHLGTGKEHRRRGCGAAGKSLPGRTPGRRILGSHHHRLLLGGPIAWRRAAA